MRGFLLVEVEMKRSHGQLKEEEGWRISGGVTIPDELADELDREEQVRDEQRRTAEEAEAKLQRVTPDPSGQGQSWTDLFSEWSGPTYKVLSREEVEKDAEASDARSQDVDVRRRKSALHKLLARRGQYRKLATLPDNWRHQLDAIEADFPNFDEVVDYLRAMFSVAQIGDQSPRLDPLLLNGPTGIGKSLFAERISAFFGSGFRRINMENAQSNSQLVGSDEFWSNSQTGAVFEALTKGDWANATFFLDEVDKVSARKEYDPTAALYGLLEPGTARVFHDLSMPGIALDASRIYWVLTSNETANIPNPILSRVRRFDLANPTQEQALRILHNIYGQVQLEVKLTTPMAPLSEEVLAPLVRVSPRRQKQLLREAMGRALYRGRKKITCADVRMPPDAREDRQQMGFY
jgi:ATP-dependent Lon protease